MLILALDTTTRQGSCALARGSAVIAEQLGDQAIPQSAQVPGELMRLLERAGVELAEIDLYAVATGPGSFTSLRIGIATMQGLAFAAGAPLVGISALDALAAIASDGTSTIHTWVDAWRGEVYAAEYRAGRAIGPPVVSKPETLLAGSAPSGAPEAAIFIGDGAATYRHLILSTQGHRSSIAEPPTPPLAGAIARRAAREADAGRLPLPHAIRPIYVRRSDAELARGNR